MASLVLTMSVSLDGFVAPIDGSSDWAAAPIARHQRWRMSRSS